MRDQRGEVIHNAHLLGFFRRICRLRPTGHMCARLLSSSGLYADTPRRRLLFHRVRPVFVFDGNAPVLKRRTTAARRKCASPPPGRRCTHRSLGGLWR